jgi:hypothetical protein
MLTSLYASATWATRAQAEQGDEEESDARAHRIVRVIPGRVYRRILAA